MSAPYTVIDFLLIAPPNEVRSTTQRGTIQLTLRQDFLVRLNKCDMTAPKICSLLLRFVVVYCCGLLLVVVVAVVTVYCCCCYCNDWDIATATAVAAAAAAAAAPSA